MPEIKALRLTQSNWKQSITLAISFWTSALKYGFIVSDLSSDPIICYKLL